MNNLFLREKESWMTWLFWGAFAAIAVFITAKNTHEISYVVVLKLAIFTVLTWYMAYSKRFSFWRAMKISFVVFSIAVTPILFMNFEGNSVLEGADIAIRLGILAVVAVVFSTVCSLIARQPKEYY